MWENHRRKIMG